MFLQYWFFNVFVTLHGNWNYWLSTSSHNYMLCKSVYIVCCNTTALPIHRLLIYHSSTQHSAPQVQFLAVLQCSSRRRDGNTTTATYHSCSRLWTQLKAWVILILYIWSEFFGRSHWYEFTVCMESISKYGIWNIVNKQSRTHSINEWNFLMPIVKDLYHLLTLCLLSSACLRWHMELPPNFTILSNIWQQILHSIPQNNCQDKRKFHS